MNNKRLSVMMALLLAMLIQFGANAATGELARFSLNSFEGWTYNRTDEDHELNRDNISHLCVKLFKSENGTDYVLTSPELDCSGSDSLSISVVYVTGTDDYTTSKLALSFVLIDGAGNRVDTVTVAAKKNQVEQTINATISLPNGLSRPKVMFAAFKADLLNHAAVRSVTITGVKSKTVVSPDVNGDGVVDIVDVNVLINALLEGSGMLNTDINGDGITDIEDVNIIINKVLTSE